MKDKLSLFEIIAGVIGFFLTLFFFIWVIFTPDKKET